MNLLEYLQSLTDIVKAHPEALEWPMIYSTDDEGNAFRSVQYSPGIGFFEDSGDFSPGCESKEKPNAVCVN